MHNPARAHKEAETARAALQNSGLAALEPYQKLQLAMAKDKQLLKAIKGLPDKAVAKRDMLPKYRNWLDEVMAAGTPDPHDTVFATAVLWLIDSGALDEAMPYVHFAITHNIQAADDYQRSLPDLLIEETASRIEAGSTITLANIEKTAALVTQTDPETGLHVLNLYDQVRAKYLKAAGEWHEEQHGGTHEHRALVLYEKALSYNDRAGVKKRIEALKKKLEK
ncbi:MAG: phage terminase small subunit [Neisseria sp.]|nr:phage terminase small subunit [Neisseria sp.]